jgi:hypothetical protein
MYLLLNAHCPPTGVLSEVATTSSQLQLPPRVFQSPFNPHHHLMSFLITTVNSHTAAVTSRPRGNLKNETLRKAGTYLYRHFNGVQAWLSSITVKGLQVKYICTLLHVVTYINQRFIPRSARVLYPISRFHLTSMHSPQRRSQYRGRKEPRNSPVSIISFTPVLTQGRKSKSRTPNTSTLTTYIKND